MEEATILFVDDEVNILNSLKRGLMDVDYNCLFVSSAEKALHVMENEEVNVIVSDMRMPGMDGLELLKIVKERWPKTVRIVLSGYAQLAQVLATVNEADIFRFILKPWKMSEEFLGVIASAVAYNRLQNEKEELEKSLRKKNEVYLNILSNMREITKFQKQHAEFRSRFMLHSFDLLSSNVSGGVPRKELADYVDCVYRFLQVTDHAQMQENVNVTVKEWLEATKQDLNEIWPIDGFSVQNVSSELENAEVAMPQLFRDMIHTAVSLMASKLESGQLSLRGKIQKNEEAHFLRLDVSLEFGPQIDRPDLETYSEFITMLMTGLSQLLEGRVRIDIEETGIVLKFKIPVMDK